MTDYVLPDPTQAKLDELKTSVDDVNTIVSNTFYQTVSVLPQGVCKGVQTGYASGVASGGSGEDDGYYDVTITAVTTTKALVLLHQTVASGAYRYCGRLTSTTNLRISTSGGNGSTVAVRWYVIEFY